MVGVAGVILRAVINSAGQNSEEQEKVEEIWGHFSGGVL
jgi:hypothetical protein